MSKKNLLNEAQIRQFMKLAKLEPLTPGFVTGLTERGSKAGDEGSVAAGKKRDTDYSGGGERKGDESKTHSGKDLEEGTEEEIDESHGRGRGEGAAGYGHPDDGGRAGARLREEEDELEAELHATEDELGDEDHLADEEGDELDDLGVDETPARTVSVEAFLDALESALETVMDDEVEVSEEPADDELEADGLEADVGVDLGDQDASPDLEDALEESAFREPPSATGAANNHKGSKQHPDHRNTKNSKGALASQGPGLVKEEDDDDDELEEGETTAFATEELVEQITKRVAARILKSALAKK